ncbi:MAG: erythromycin biosynthesis sensory transduction protein eryC1 [Gammaproteobacteria bacterium]|nr:MAG: erythromycin biosynthesis sensory transduction protein eryC1 [Gammaproteobacteria bacterium]
MLPMVDLQGQYKILKDEIEPKINEALSRAHYILGENVNKFESEAANFLNVKFAIGCASGTDALLLSLLSSGIKKGDEVITTAFTFIATAEAIAYIGAKPVFVDIDPITLNIDTDEIKKAITDKTSAIIPVHLFGLPANMDEILKIAKENNLKIIEDCAQSFGAKIDDKTTGGIGDAGAFSFFPSKNLGCFGDGGLVVTNSEKIAGNVKILRNHGSSVRYYHDRIGYNSRLDELQAVVLRVKLKYINQYNQNRHKVGKMYNELLADLPIQCPVILNDRDHAFHQYTFLSDKRDDIMKVLQDNDISSAIYYPVPLHQQKVFKNNANGTNVSLPITEQTAKKCLSLPIYPELDEKNIKKISNLIHSVF